MLTFRFSIWQEPLGGVQGDTSQGYLPPQPDTQLLGLWNSLLRQTRKISPLPNYPKYDAMPPVHPSHVPMSMHMQRPLRRLAWSVLQLAFFLSRLPPPSLILPASCCKDQSPKKNAQFVMSCPAVNLPSVSHGEDLLSPIYLFATWTIEGPRPAEFSIIKPPTISPITPPLPPPPCQQH